MNKEQDIVVGSYSLLSSHPTSPLENTLLGEPLWLIPPKSDLINCLLCKSSMQLLA
jgi:hypothetical protein